MENCCENCQHWGGKKLRKYGTCKLLPLKNSNGNQKFAITQQDYLCDNYEGDDSMKFKISAYTLDGQFIKSFRFANRAIKEYKLNSGDIANCLSGRQKVAGNLQFCRVGEEHKIENLNGRRIRQYTMEGEFIQEYENAKVASEATQTNYKLLITACNKRIKSTNGFQWSYDDEILDGKVYPRVGRFPVYQYDLQGNYIREFSSPYSAIKELGLKSTSVFYIKSVCEKKKQYKSCAGYQWSYEKHLDGIGNISKDTGMHRSNSKKISSYDLNGNYVETFNSIANAGRKFGLVLKSANQNISVACRKKSSAYGFQWRLGDSTENIGRYDVRRGQKVGTKRNMRNPEKKINKRESIWEFLK